MPTYRLVKRPIQVTHRKYITKKIRQQYKYWKILIGTFVLAICIVGAFQQYTLKYINGLTAPIHATHFFVGVAKAETVEEVVPEVTKTIETESVEQMVDRVIKETNFKWPSYLKRLIKCESGWNPNNTNVHGNNPSTSKDRGLVQINNHWHSEVTDAQAYDPEFSVRFAINMINRGQQGQWACDRIIRNAK